MPVIVTVVKIDDDTLSKIISGYYIDNPTEIPPRCIIESSYNHMIGRCTRPSDSNYHNYGAKGITVCQDWLYDFEAFKLWSLNHGAKNGYCIDRIDSTLGYCPGNCQWISKSENSSRRKYDNFYKRVGSQD